MCVCVCMCVCARAFVVCFLHVYACILLNVNNMIKFVRLEYVMKMTKNDILCLNWMYVCICYACVFCTNKMPPISWKYLYEKKRKNNDIIKLLMFIQFFCRMSLIIQARIEITGQKNQLNRHYFAYIDTIPALMIRYDYSEWINVTGLCHLNYMYFAYKCVRFAGWLCLEG